MYMYVTLFNVFEDQMKCFSEHYNTTGDSLNWTVLSAHSNTELKKTGVHMYATGYWVGLTKGRGRIEGGDVATWYFQRTNTPTSLVQTNTHLPAPPIHLSLSLFLSLPPSLPPSLSLSLSPSPGFPPLPVTNLQGRILNSTAIELTWDAPTDSTDVDVYIVSWRASSSSESSPVFVTGDHSSVIVNGLKFGQAYVFSVQGNNRFGFSDLVYLNITLNPQQGGMWYS